MEHWSPLIQTALWVGLVACIVRRYGKQIGGILDALQRRIEAGDDVRFGPLELKVDVQEPAQQKQRVLEEVKLVQTELRATPDSQSVRQAPHAVAEAYQAEDLALRAIQARYGAPIQRQIVFDDAPLEGLFTLNGQLNIVEVKLVFTRETAQAVIQRSVNNFVALLHKHHWKNVRILIAIVFENAAEMDPKLAENDRYLDDIEQVQMRIHLFSLAELKEQFGLAG